MILLTGCETTSNACPPLVEYDDTFREKLSLEVRGIPEMFVHIPRALDDYRVLRQQVRACHS